MKIHHRLFVWLGIISCGAGCLVARAEEETPAAKVQAALARLTEGESHGVAVLVARDGRVLGRFTAGYADVAAKTPVTADTKFRIGSVSKQFTAAALVRLAEQGKLSLDDPLEKFFPGFPHDEDTPLHRLLTHTSGLRSYTDKPDFLSKVTAPITPAALIESFKNDPPDFAPGEGFHYNNSAYFLAGEIVAQVSGRSFADYLRETFFEPLGMKDTGIYDNAHPPANMARGYEMKDGQPAPALDWDMSWAGGAGALYSTLDDLFRWNEALFGGRVVNPASLQAMLTPVSLPEGVDGLAYGYGLVISEWRRLPSVSHGGGLNGWSSLLTWLPESKATIVVLTNALPAKPSLEPSVVMDKVASLYLNEDLAKLPPRKEDPTVDAKTYADFAGRYDYQNAVLTTTVEDGRLFAQLTGQPKYEIFPEAPDVFFWKVVEAKVTFIRNDQGQVIAARHTQGGNTFTAPRLKESDGPKLTDAELDAILGDYQYGLGVVLTVTRDGSQVYAQLTGQPRFPIHSKSAIEYEWRVVPATVRFVKDDAGQVAKAIHEQNGATIDAPKVK